MAQQYGLEVYTLPEKKPINVTPTCKKPIGCNNIHRKTKELVVAVQAAIMIKMAQEIKEHIQNFMMRGQVTPSLSWSTSYFRTRLGFGTAPTYQTGQLASSIEVKALGPTNFSVGVPFSKAHINMFGGSISAGKLSQWHHQTNRIVVSKPMSRFFMFGALNGLFPSYFIQIKEGHEIWVEEHPFIKQGTLDWIRGGGPAKYSAATGAAIAKIMKLDLEAGKSVATLLASVTKELRTKGI